MKLGLKNHFLKSMMLNSDILESEKKDIHLGIKSEDDFANEVFFVNTSVTIKTGHDEIVLSATFRSEFEYDGEKNDDALSKALPICTAMIIPYIREFIIDITRRMPFIDPIFLPYSLADTAIKEGCVGEHEKTL